MSPWETAIELACKDYWYSFHPSQWQITIRKVALSISVSRPLWWSRAQQALTALCYESVCLCQLQQVTVMGRTAVHRLMLWVSNLSFPVMATVTVQWWSRSVIMFHFHRGTAFFSLPATMLICSFICLWTEFRTTVRERNNLIRTFIHF